MGDGGGGGVLALIIEQAHCLHIGVRSQNQAHHCVGVQIVGGAGQIGAGGLQAGHQSGADGIGDGRKYHRNRIVLRSGLHRHRYRSGHTHHQIHIIGNKVRNDLVEYVGIGIADIIRDLKCNIMLFPQCLQLRLKVFHNLV